MGRQWGCGQVGLAIVQQEGAGMVGRDLKGKVRCCGLYGADYQGCLFVMVQPLVFLFVGRADLLVSRTWVVCFAVGVFDPICNME